MNSNEINGKIPSTISELVNLERLYLHNNQLAGSFPATNISNLSNLTILLLESNQLTDLPDLSDLSSLSYLYVQNNSLTFEDIEPNIDITNLIYSPQNKTGEEETHHVSIGADYTISVNVGGENNNYQWYKAGTTITGAVKNSYTIINFSEIDNIGIYYCEITNTQVPLLTLTSEDITLVEEAGEITIDATTNIAGTTCTLSGIIAATTQFSTNNTYTFIPENLSNTAHIIIQYPDSENKIIQFEIDKNYNISNVKIEIEGSYIPLNPDFFNIVQNAGNQSCIIEIFQIENICVYHPE